MKENENTPQEEMQRISALGTNATEEDLLRFQELAAQQTPSKEVTEKQRLQAGEKGKDGASRAG